MRPFPACVWELLLLVVLVQATSTTNDDKHICIRQELRDHEGTTEIPMKKSDAVNCVDPSSCVRRIQRNRLRWFNVSRCCPGYKPTPHPKELVCVSACPDGCPEFAKCHSRGSCICKNGLQTVSRTPLVCADPTTNTTYTADAGKTAVTSPSPNLTTSDASSSPETDPTGTWSSSPPSPNYVGVVESEFPGFFRREMEDIDMSSAGLTTRGGLLSIWVIIFFHFVAEWS